MAKKTSRQSKVAATSRPSGDAARAGWVRKNILIDPYKLDLVRRKFDLATDTEAVDRALDSIVFAIELNEGMEAFSRTGGIDDVFERL